MGTIVEREGKNGKSYQAKVRIGEKPYTATFPTKSQAKRWITETEAKILKGESVDIHKVRKVTLSEVFSEYIRDGKISDKKKSELERLKIEIGRYSIGEWNSRRLRDYINLKLNQTIQIQPKKQKDHSLYKAGKNEEGQLRTYSASSVRKYYYDIRTALVFHSKTHDYQFNSKPFDDNPPPESWENPRDRRLQGNELERLINACDDMYENKQNLKDLIYFQIYSCMRIGETLKMRWCDIRINEKEPWGSYIFVPKAHQKSRKKKGIQDREVSMRPELFSLIKKILERKDEAKENDKVFPFWKSSAVIGSRFKVICKNAKVDDFVIHDFRHEGLSQLFENTNLTDIEISKISGHTELNTLSRYAKLRPAKTGQKLWNGFADTPKNTPKKILAEH